jgi:DNA-binding NtrC family response regulator
MDAGRGALRLSAFLIRRGRVRDALKLLDEARSYWTRVGETVGMIDVATLAGVARTDLAVLDEAESALGAALAAARAHADVARVASASLALARVRFWRGQYADAAALLASVDAESLSSEESIRRQVLVSRTAVGLRDPGRAVTEAVGALDLARSLERPALVGEAACALAFAHLSVGDFEAVDRDVALGVAAARAARDPLRGVRCRLLLAERARRGGQRSTAAMLVSRFEKIAASAFPPILRARCALLRDLAVESPPVRECVGRHVAATGLNALELFTPAGRTQPSSAAAMLTDDMVEIVEICHTAETETTLLQEVCRRLRRQLRAAAVGFVGLDGSVCAPLATDGARVDVGVAERAIASGMSVPPHRVADRLEAAAPVRYGGITLGAVVARWTLGTADCSANGALALALAATAAAPAVAAALDGRRRSPGTAGADLIGVSTAIGEVRRAVELAAAAPFSVLIEGESGSGKELVARALHKGGVRGDRRFCSVNCAALPDDLVESELFGHARGAFTGAAADRPGVFEEAHGGTLFLDEISELSARAQAKLLRVVQDGELRRVGENVSRRVDVRVVSATNRALRGEVTGGRFRLDLLYRLDVIRIIVPPLRDRREDVPVLADHFWREVAARVGSRATLAASAVAALARYDWPGNVRELQNVLAALVVRAPKRGVVPPTALPPQFGLAARDDACRLDEARRTFEARFVRAALVRTGGHRTRAAAELGVTRQGLTKLMARLGLESQWD